MKDPHLVTSCVLHGYDDGDEDVYLRFNRWTFPKFKDALESLEPDKHVVIIVGQKRDDFGISIHASDIIIIDPDDEYDDDEELLVD